MELMITTTQAIGLVVGCINFIQQVLQVQVLQALQVQVLHLVHHQVRPVQLLQVLRAQPQQQQ